MPASLRSSWRVLLSCLHERSAALRLSLGLAVVLPLVFKLYTGLIWEDFFITYRASENLAQGHGLVFTPGERVQGFTSAINTLLPALVAWVTHAADFRVPLLVYTAVSLAALLFGVISITSILAAEPRPEGRHRWLWLLFPVLVVLEIKTTAFTMSGQEAGFMLCFLAPIFAFAYDGWPRHWALGGICFAGLMYTRPDGFIYIGAVAGAALAFSPEPRRPLLVALMRSALLGSVIYLPWLLFTWSYFGSPIPHTIIAKHQAMPDTYREYGPLAAFVGSFLLLPERLCGTLLAIYDYGNKGGEGAWPVWTRAFALVAELMAVTYWLVPTRDRLGRMASLVAMLGMAYLSYASLVAPSSPGYYPPVAFFSLLALLRLCMTVPEYFRHARWTVIAAPALAGALLFFLGFIFTHSLRPLKLKQDAIEWGHRRLIGEWLRDNATPAETIYIECLGYVGYFSHRKIHDWPGLVSPEVVRIRREFNLPPYPWGWVRAAEKLRPDWIVARVTENELLKHSAALTGGYKLVKVFNASEAIVAAGEFDGRNITYNDAVFFIYHRIPPTPPAAAPPPPTE